MLNLGGVFLIIWGGFVRKVLKVGKLLSSNSITVDFFFELFANSTLLGNFIEEVKNKGIALNLDNLFISVKTLTIY